ncbi:MAG: succinylglutamate desuccinylase/aspartoacylase family protein [Paracoccaceae bacterium]
MVQTSVLGHGIVSIKSGNPGCTIGVLCNVHGNEPCGRTGLRQVLDSYPIENGTLVIIDANPEAALLDQRYVTADMNRMFTTELLAYRDPHHDLARAQYLSKLLPGLGLDCAVDLHSTSSATKFPFAVGFTGADPIIELCPIARISGWNETFMAGTLVEWLCKNGVPAVTVEGGQHRSQQAVEVAERVLLSVLSQFKLIRLEEPILSGTQKRFKIIEHVVVGDAASFKFSKPYASFDKLGPSDVIARDKTRKYLAPVDDGFSILMPGDQKAINRGKLSDAYYLIKKIQM